MLNLVYYPEEIGKVSDRRQKFFITNVLQRFSSEPAHPHFGITTARSLKDTHLRHIARIILKAPDENLWIFYLEIYARNAKYRKQYWRNLHRFPFAIETNKSL